MGWGQKEVFKKQRDPNYVDESDLYFVPVNVCVCVLFSVIQMAKFGETSVNSLPYFAKFRTAHRPVFSLALFLSLCSSFLLSFTLAQRILSLALLCLAV